MTPSIFLQELQQEDDIYSDEEISNAETSWARSLCSTLMLKKLLQGLKFRVVNIRENFSRRCMGY